MPDEEWDVLYGDRGIQLATYTDKNTAEYDAAKFTARTPYKHWVEKRVEKKK